MYVLLPILRDLMKSKFDQRVVSFECLVNCVIGMEIDDGFYSIILCTIVHHSTVFTFVDVAATKQFIHTRKMETYVFDLLNEQTGVNLNY